MASGGVVEGVAGSRGGWPLVAGQGLSYLGQCQHPARPGAYGTRGVPPEAYICT